MTWPKTRALLVGIPAVLLGVTLIAGPAALLTEGRDQSGYYTSRIRTVSAPSAAVVAGDWEVLTGGPAWLAEAASSLIDVRIHVDEERSGRIFVGVAEADAVDGYLADVSFHQIADSGFAASSWWNLGNALSGLGRSGQALSGSDDLLGSNRGERDPNPPGRRDFWAVSSHGAGPQTVEWPVEPGRWRMVVMNADASPGVDADLSIGIRVAHVAALAWSLVALGVAFLVGGGYVLYRAYPPPPRAASNQHSDISGGPGEPPL